jgi:hypothetical protein
VDWRALVKDLSLQITNIRVTFFLAKGNPRDHLHHETMDFLRLSTALNSCQNIISKKE